MNEDKKLDEDAPFSEKKPYFSNKSSIYTGGKDHERRKETA